MTLEVDSPVSTQLNQRFGAVAADIIQPPPFAGTPTKRRICDDSLSFGQWSCANCCFAKLPSISDLVLAQQAEQLEQTPEKVYETMAPKVFR